MPTTNTSQTSTKATETVSGGQPQTYGGGMFGGGDLANSLLSLMSQQMGVMKTANSARQEAVAGQLQSQALELELKKQVAGEVGALAAQRAEIAYTQNKQLEQHQRDFGMDPQAANNEIAKNLAVRNQLEPQLEAARKEYDSAASIGLLDNPLGFIFAQLKLPTLAAKNNAIAHSIARADENILQRTQMLGEVKRTVAANNADAIRANQLKQAELDSKLAQAGLHAAEAANRGAVATAAMQDIQVANMFGDNQRQAIMGIATLKDQQEQRAFRLEQQALLREQRMEALNAKKASAEEMERMNLRLKVVSDMMGLQEPATWQQLKEAPQNVRDAWFKAARNGQFGDDLLASLSFFEPQASRNGMAQTGIDKVYDTAQRLKQAGMSKEGEAATQYARENQGKIPKREDAIKLGFGLYENNVVNAAMGPKHPQDLSSSKWDKDFNPYRVPALAFTGAINTSPELAPLKNNLVAKGVQALAGAAGLQGTELSAAQEQQVLGSIRAQVASGTLKPEVAAAHIAQYYKTGAEWNKKTTAYTQFGLPVQSAYFYTLEGSFMGPEAKKVDLFDAAGIERALTLEKVRSSQVWGETPFGFR